MLRAHESILGNINRKNGRESAAQLMSNKHMYGQAQLEKNQALLDMSRQANGSLLLAAEPSMPINK